MKTELRLSIHREKIAVFCQKHHIRKLAFFGSALRDDF
jgi:predicted nucleotidyltransferase